jgi:hypothetical protein
LTTETSQIHNLLVAAAFLSAAAGIGMRLLPSTGPGLWLGQTLMLLQLAALRYDVTAHVPGPDALRAGMAAVAKVSALNEPVLAPYHPYLLHVAGRPMHMQFHMLNELFQAQAHGARLETGSFVPDLLDGLAKRRWRAVITSETPGGHEINTWIDNEVRRQYQPRERLLPADDVQTLFPRTGNSIRPSTVYLPEQ